MDCIHLLNKDWKITGDMPTPECNIEEIFKRSGGFKIHLQRDVFSIDVWWSATLIPGGAFELHYNVNRTSIINNIYPTSQYDTVETWINKRIEAVEGAVYGTSSSLD